METSYNLFEGNIVQEISISDWWGPVGPGNTYFRNRVETKDISIRDHSHQQSLIGNVLVKGTIAIDPSVNDTMLNGNWKDGQITWNPAAQDRALPVSCYYKAKPTFYGSSQWPSLGADLPEGTNPALERYTRSTGA